MGQTIYFRNGLTVAAVVDEKGPLLEFSAAGALIGQSGAHELIRALQDWTQEMKQLGICMECNTKTPLHKIGCRQAPKTF